MSSSQKGNITVIALALIVVVLGTLLFTQRDRLTSFGGGQNLAQVSSTSSKTATVGVSIPVKEIDKDFSFTINVKNTSAQKKTFKNYSVTYQVLDESGVTSFTSSPLETLPSLTLEPGAVHTVGSTFDFKKTPLSVGVYTLRAVVDGIGTGQNKFTVIDTSSPKSVKLPPVVKTVGEPIKLPPVTPTPPVTTPPSTPPNTSPATNTSSVFFSITANKSTFALNEAIRGSVTLKNTGDKEVKLSFTSGCYTKTLLNNATEQTACTTSLSSVTIPAKGTKVIGFIFQKGASTNGLKTIKVQVIGHTGIATLQVGVGTAKATSLTSATVPLDGQAPVVNPPVVTPTPPVPPVTPPVVLPPVQPPAIANGSIFLKATDRAGYISLASTLTQYSANAATPANKKLFLAAAKALTDTVAQVPASQWNSTDPNKVPSTFFVEVSDASSPSFAKKSNWLASAWNAIRSIFAGNTQSGRYTFSMYGAQNNVCQRYRTIHLVNEEGTINNYSLEQVTQEIKYSIEMKPLYASGVHEFTFGVCGPLSTYLGLKKFDVSLANNAAEYIAHQSVSPHDNSSYYDTNGTPYINRNALDTIIKKGQIEYQESTMNFPATFHAMANMYTASNDFGPTHFECSIGNLYSVSAPIVEKKQIDSCYTDSLLYYQMKGRKIGHVEHVKSIKINSNTYDIVTDDTADQGRWDVLKPKYVYDNIPSERAENKYTFAYGQTSTFMPPSLVGLSLPATPASIVKDSFYTGNTFNPLQESLLLMCTDKSDIIRELPNAKWAPIQFNLYNKIADHWVTTNEKDLRAVYAQQGIEEFLPYGWTPPGPGHPESWYNSALGPNPDYILPDFSKCKNDVKIDAEVKIYETAMEAWTRKWNKKAYENKGYVPKDSLASLDAEKQKIMDALNDKIYKYHSCVDREKVTSGDPTWEAIQKKWWDTVWIPAAKEAGLKIDEIKSNPTCGLLK